MSAFTTFTSRLPAMLHGDAMRRRRWSWRGVALLVFGGLSLFFVGGGPAFATNCSSYMIWALDFEEGSVSPSDTADQVDSGDSSMESWHGWKRAGVVSGDLTLNVLVSGQYIHLRRVEDTP